MKTDIFPYSGWVQLEDGLWARCKHPFNARQVTGGSLDPALVGRSGDQEGTMMGALGRVIDRRERHLGPQAVVELPGYSATLGAPVLLRAHTASSVCTSLKPYSAYTGLGDNA